MGFNSVYKVLLEVFPDVDSRLLRAVAVEHSKDADTAVEAVLMEVLPYLSERSIATTSMEKVPVLDSDSVAQTDNGCPDSRCLDEAGNDLLFHDANCGHEQECGGNSNEEVILLEKRDEINDKIVPNEPFHDPSVPLTHEGGSCQIEEKTSLGIDATSCSTSVDLKDENSGVDQSLNGDLHAIKDDIHHLITCDLDSNVQKQDNEELSHEDVGGWLVKNPMVQSAVQSSSDIVSDLVIVDMDKTEPSDFTDGVSNKDSSAIVMADLEDDSALNSIVSQSGQICNIDVLENIIEDAKSNKKILFAAMDSVIELMREVELQERSAEKAKEEAEKGGSGINTRVEDLKQMIQRAKEANDMHAGEVYGEKSILATEMRELQSRLISLSDERDMAIGVLNEMRGAIEVRLGEAEKVKKAAEEEKLKREEAERKELAELEEMMDKVVQESRLLKEEADKNNKLREFLMDRGLVVDTLQGEICVICEDVKLLKERFDERIPLSKSILSTQTTCILAASSSSSSSSSTSSVVIYQPPPSTTPPLSPHLMLQTEKKEDREDEHEHKHDDDDVVTGDRLVDDDWVVYYDGSEDVV